MLKRPPTTSAHAKDYLVMVVETCEEGPCRDQVVDLGVLEFPNQDVEAS